MSFEAQLFFHVYASVGLEVASAGPEVALAFCTWSIVPTVGFDWEVTQSINMERKVRKKEDGKTTRQRLS